ncbi:MAG: hypothetical protein ABL914_03255 [Novosphingobium sp.]|uniref:hypothetical protein n=1 Tax=Novosphingobium sp. TaxID=1874826 RepID=UPI0032B938C7
MGLFLIFLLGIANFAAHQAVLDSRHPLLDRVPFFYMLGGRFSLAVEFAMLVGAMLVVANGSAGWVFFYALYSGVNLLSAWLIRSGRV